MSTERCPHCRRTLEQPESRPVYARCMGITICGRCQGGESDIEIAHAKAVLLAWKYRAETRKYKTVLDIMRDMRDQYRSLAFSLKYEIDQKWSRRSSWYRRLAEHYRAITRNSCDVCKNWVQWAGKWECDYLDCTTVKEPSAKCPRFERKR